VLRGRVVRDFPGGKWALPCGKKRTRPGVVLGHYCRAKYGNFFLASAEAFANLAVEKPA